MERHYPKFEQRQNVDLTKREASRTHGREGVVVSYNSFKNTATVVLALPKTQEIGPIHENVPCPTNVGVIGVAPEPGRGCWVQFKDDNERNPIITHFYNPHYSKYDYPAQTPAKSMVPRYYNSI
jgi:hypothetical protein